MRRRTVRALAHRVADTHAGPKTPYAAMSALFLSTLTHSPANGAHAHNSDAENPMGVAGRLVTLQERELTYHDCRVSRERAWPATLENSCSQPQRVAVYCTRENFAVNAIFTISKNASPTVFYSANLRPLGQGSIDSHNTPNNTIETRDDTILHPQVANSILVP